ncbi:MAG: hypothetical protein AAF693_18485 [Bacteroidota bacterium]
MKKKILSALTDCLDHKAKQVSMHYQFTFAFVLISTILSGQTFKIGLAHTSEAERITKKKLVNALASYDTRKWWFTDTLVISDNQIPHSHPVLTLNTRPQSELSLISVFIHENIHWFLVDKSGAIDQALDELKKKYKEVPVGYPQGAMNEYSTYLHLIVNYLEYDGIRQLAGADKARDVIQSKDYYQWIYQRIIEESVYFDDLIKMYKLEI